MPRLPAWNEVESEVDAPGRVVALVVGMVFLLLGLFGLALVGRMPPGFPIGIGRAACAAFALLGAVPVAWSLRQRLRPVRIRHAAPDVLPDVPKEPVIREGSVAHGRVTHELAETPQDVEFRPSPRLWRNDVIFFLGFGIPFLSVFAGILSWQFHDRLGWVLAALSAIGLTLLGGGTAFGLIAAMMRASYRRLGRLGIPRDGGDLELDLPAEPDVDRADLAEGLRWMFVGDGKRRRLTIPQNLVAAVQLCPWKFRLQDSVGWAVQGLLVLEPSAKNVHPRVPLLLTGDFAGAARLMRQLADVLEVPFLFGADRAGRRAEAERATTRPPLRCGGTQS